MWHSDLGNSLTPEEWGWFELAIQELKTQIMLEREATGSEAIDAVMREKIDGRTLLDVMRQGLQLRLKRIKTDQTELKSAIEINSRTRIKPDDDETARALADFQQNLSKKLEKLTREITATEAELSELEAKANPTKPAGET